MIKRGFIAVAVLLWGAGLLHAQTSPEMRSGKLILFSDTTLLDTSVIIRGSVFLSGGSAVFSEGADYQVDYSRALLINKRIPPGTAVNISYKVLMLPVGKPFAHKDPAIVHPEFRITQNPFLYSPEAQGSSLFNKDGLKMNGNISRGVAVGNNQNIVLNSNLNLQLAGKLSDVDVLAAISDENNPIQPEGNTQQLQDFDKVYIQLSKDRTRLTVGDFEMVRPAGYFMNYYKKSRGGQIYSAFDAGKYGVLKAGGEGAISRGRFARNIINGIEGNQGPYRLSGTNGETYIILISGTEAIYLDGEKLTRGEQNDYIIDYNSGELVFSPKRVITQYSRIVAEFQYSDRNYARSVFHVNTEFEAERYAIRLNYFTEQDNKDQPFLQDLNDTNKALLASVGDNLAAALAPSAVRTNTFSKNRIMYRKIDSLGYTGIYTFTDDPASDTVFYELRFSLIGANRGNYILAQTGANGRVFQWAAPVGGVPQGDYEPVTQLVSPKRLQMITAAADVKLSEFTQVSVEYARSQYDKNLYSDLDKRDDGGNGIRVAIDNMIPLESKKEDFWNVRSQVAYEHVDKNFRYVERYRNVEFDRIWNRLLTNQATQDTGYDEHIVSFRTSLNKLSIGTVFYQLGFYDRDISFRGFQNQAGAALRYKRNIFTGDAEWIDTRNTSGISEVKNETRRYRADYGREILFFVAGTKYETERSRFFRGGDTLIPGSYGYDQYSFYVRNRDTSTLRYRLEYTQREDFLPRTAELANSTTGKNITGTVDWLQKNSNRLSAGVTYREFIVRDTNLVKLEPERTILARIEYDYGFMKRVFTANTYFQLGSGNELRRDYQFLEVQVGQGQYVWKDFNGDDKQTLNEFVLASFADKYQANYIKVFLPTNTTIRTNSNQFNQTLNITPSAVWANKKGMKKVVSKFSNQTALKLDRKTTDLSTSDFINPFLRLNDSSIITNNSLIRNTVFFNRNDPSFGADVNYQDSKSKSFLTNGFDTRRRQEQGANVRWNFTTMLGITLGYTYGDRTYYSDFFAANNYNYHFDEIRPKLIYQVTQNLRVTFLFSYFEGTTASEFGSLKGTNREVGSEARYAIARAGALNAKFSTYKVGFNGDISSPLGYDMLQGFVIGNNQLWNVNYQQRLGNNVQITVNYDGRKSEGQSVVHVGRVEARYLF